MGYKIVVWVCVIVNQRGVIINYTMGLYNIRKALKHNKLIKIKLYKQLF